MSCRASRKLVWQRFSAEHMQVSIYLLSKGLLQILHLFNGEGAFSDEQYTETPNTCV
jgi:hypothetical protein